MRKRAQGRIRTLDNEPKHIIQKTRMNNKTKDSKKKWWVALALAGIFLLVLVMNTYFNVTSGVSINEEGEGFDKYYLSGPDPYYNMRLVDETLYGADQGHYPFFSEEDPLLRYPIGRSGHRAPLLNMMAIGFSRFLIPVMDEVDAVGYSMQFVPALFGALLIFPVYFIGKTLFNKKAALIGALFIAIIPIHLGSGHGSAYTLFDHDSFNLLLFFITFAFLIKGIKEKDRTKSIIYALLSGIPIAALTMTWVEARYLYAIIAIYAIIQMIIDIFTSKINPSVARTTSIALIFGYLISAPVDVFARYGGFILNVPLFLTLGVIVFSLIYYFLSKKKLPWTISLPILFIISGLALVFLYFIQDMASFTPLSKLNEILFGVGVYGNKVSMTIAEAGTYDISRTVMSFGPVLYWLAWVGFILIAYLFYKNNQRRDFLFILILFLIDVWFTGIAGRFLNDFVPLIAILGGWVVWVLIDKINYKQMIRNIKRLGGGIHGIRRGVKFLHLFGIIFLAFIVIYPNTYLSLDAAIPYDKKEDIFGDLPNGAFGLSHGKEAYWIDAYNWLNDQDTEIEELENRPAFISWWDYGFYEVAIGEHPTVADNFQDGIPPAANFHTSSSEEEAISIWIIRLLEGYSRNNNGKLSEDIIETLEKRVGENDTINIVRWIENPEESPSYNTPIGREYNEELSLDYPVGQQWPINAVYHDISKLLVEKYDDEEITLLYRDIQEVTGYSIRYYGVEGYDKQIFNIFGFLADRSLLLVAGGGLYNPEDDFVEMRFVTESGNELTFEEVEELSDTEMRADPPIRTTEYFKDTYFETMFYKTYVGFSEGDVGSLQEPEYQLPCLDMKHFYAEFISNISKYAYYSGKSAVVIAKYYAGAVVNGSVTFMDESYKLQAVVQKNITHYGTEIPIDHDKENTTNGNFSVIVPAGDFQIQLRRYGDSQIRAFPMKNISFNRDDDSEFARITEYEAMRRGGNIYRNISIDIESANIEGYVFENNDNNESYNISIDAPISDVEVTIIGIQDFNEETGYPETYDYEWIRDSATDNNGYYNASGLLPGYYEIRFIQDDFLLHADIIGLYSGSKNYNVSKPKPANVEGTIYFDDNNNGEYDGGEELADVDIDLQYLKIDTTKKLVESLTTDESGKYSFTSLVMGQYLINATKGLDYALEEPITLDENQTLYLNISINYAKVEIDGYTNSNGDPVGGINIQFNPDMSAENNTAEQKQTSSDANGSYSIKIMPGYYNVTVDFSGEQGTYSADQDLYVAIGEGAKLFDISMGKHTFTITGETTYEGTNIENVTITFSPNMDTENNTAEFASTKSKTDGTYMIELLPGEYIINLRETINESGIEITYSYEEELSISNDREYNIALIKE